jgi:hypothetical protein
MKWPWNRKPAHDRDRGLDRPGVRQICGLRGLLPIVRRVRTFFASGFFSKGLRGVKLCFWFLTGQIAART